MSPDPAPVWKAAPLGQRVRGMGDGQAGLETFGTDDIERAVGEVSYLRGLDYFVRGMVRSVEFGPAGRIYGEVSGSRPKPYAVAVKYEFPPASRTERPAAGCTASGRIRAGRMGWRPRSPSPTNRVHGCPLKPSRWLPPFARPAARFRARGSSP